MAVFIAYILGEPVAVVTDEEQSDPVEVRAAEDHLCAMRAANEARRVAARPPPQLARSMLRSPPSPGLVDEPIWLW